MTRTSARRRRTTLGLAGAIIAISTFGCQTTTPDRPSEVTDADARAGLLSTQDLPRVAFTLRHHLRFVFGDRSGSVEAVLQKGCDHVTVVGLSPFGTRLFSVRQSGSEVIHEPTQQRAWPFPPHRMLIDIQRIYLYPLRDPPPADGAYESFVGETRVVEDWRAGRLRTRVLTVSSAQHPEHIVIRYQGSFGDGSVPSLVEFSDQTREYRLEVETISFDSRACVDQRVERK